MSKKLNIQGFVMTILMTFATIANGQTSDATTVNTNNTSTSTSTVNSTNVNTNNNYNVNDTTVNSNSLNTNINQSTSTNTNYNYGDTTSTNINQSTSTNTNINQNTSTSTSNNTNTNINQSTSTNTNNNYGHTTSANTNTNVNQSTSTSQQVVDTNNRNENINKSEITQKVIQPPPTAIAPAMMSGGNSDLCTTGVSGAVQTQILGISGGGTIRDMNCERLKLSKTLYDMGMKVAAVSTMCQDERVFTAMMNAGTPCPIDGKIGQAALAAWQEEPSRQPKKEVEKQNDAIKGFGLGAALTALLIFLF